MSNITLQRVLFQKLDKVHIHLFFLLFFLFYLFIRNREVKSILSLWLKYKIDNYTKILLKNKERERERMLLFVYGTLMKDLWNHNLLKTSNFLGEFETVDNHTLSIEGKIPCLSSKQELYKIKGEVYEVSKHTLKFIDEIECEGVWYHRRNISVVKADSTSDHIDHIIAQAYFNDDDGLVLEHGDYRRFLDSKNK